MTVIGWAIWCAAVMWGWEQFVRREPYKGDSKFLSIAGWCWFLGTAMMIWKTVDP